MSRGKKAKAKAPLAPATNAKAKKRTPVANSASSSPNASTANAGSSTGASARSRTRNSAVSRIRSTANPASPDSGDTTLPGSASSESADSPTISGTEASDGMVQRQLGDDGGPAATQPEQSSQSSPASPASGELATEPAHTHPAATAASPPAPQRRLPAGLRDLLTLETPVTDAAAAALAHETDPFMALVRPAIGNLLNAADSGDRAAAPRPNGHGTNTQNAEQNNEETAVPGPAAYWHRNLPAPVRAGPPGAPALWPRPAHTNHGIDNGASRVNNVASRINNADHGSNNAANQGNADQGLSNGAQRRQQAYARDRGNGSNDGPHEREPRAYVYEPRDENVFWHQPGYIPRTAGPPPLAGRAPRPPAPPAPHAHAHGGPAAVGFGGVVAENDAGGGFGGFGDFAGFGGFGDGYGVQFGAAALPALPLHGLPALPAFPAPVYHAPAPAGPAHPALPARRRHAGFAGLASPIRLNTRTAYDTPAQPVRPHADYGQFAGRVLETNAQREAREAPTWASSPGEAEVEEIVDEEDELASESDEDQPSSDGANGGDYGGNGRNGGGPPGPSGGSGGYSGGNSGNGGTGGNSRADWIDYSWNDGSDNSSGNGGSGTSGSYSGGTTHPADVPMPPASPAPASDAVSDLSDFLLPWIGKKKTGAYTSDPDPENEAKPCLPDEGEKYMAPMAAAGAEADEECKKLDVADSNIQPGANEDADAGELKPGRWTLGAEAALLAALGRMPRLTEPLSRAEFAAALARHEGGEHWPSALVGALEASAVDAARAADLARQAILNAGRATDSTAAGCSALPFAIAAPVATFLPFVPPAAHQRRATRSSSAQPFDAAAHAATLHERLLAVAGAEAADAVAARLGSTHGWARWRKRIAVAGFDNFPGAWRVYTQAEEAARQSALMLEGDGKKRRHAGQAGRPKRARLGA